MKYINKKLPTLEIGAEVNRLEFLVINFLAKGKSNVK